MKLLKSLNNEKNWLSDHHRSPEKRCLASAFIFHPVKWPNRTTRPYTSRNFESLVNLHISSGEHIWFFFEKGASDMDWQKWPRIRTRDNRSIESFYDSFATRNPANPFNHPLPLETVRYNWIETNSTIAICFRGSQAAFRNRWKRDEISSRIVVIQRKFHGSLCLTFRVTLRTIARCLEQRT